MAAYKVESKSYRRHPIIHGRCVREFGRFSLEEASMKMTSELADRLGLVTRGIILAGKVVDIVAFDPETVLG